MHLARISELLAPYVGGDVSETQLAQLAAYLEILHRWNARMNLTAIREPEQVVTRHFGESLFAGRALYPSGAGAGEELVDIGSGAGFPGLAIKIWAPPLSAILVEAHQKKATFLREVIHALELTGISVAAVRAEDLPVPSSARVTVTMRAVEQFDRVLPRVAGFAASGRLALLIGSAQVRVAQKLVPNVTWSEPLPIPLSDARVLLVGTSP